MQCDQQMGSNFQLNCRDFNKVNIMILVHLKVLICHANLSVRFLKRPILENDKVYWSIECENQIELICKSDGKCECMVILSYWGFFFVQFLFAEISLICMPIVKLYQVQLFCSLFYYKLNLIYKIYMNQFKRKKLYYNVKYQQYWDQLICLYLSNEELMIIDQQGKLIKSIDLSQNLIDFYCCLNPRYIILQFQYQEFAIRDLLEDKDQKYKGIIIGQKDNKILFNKDWNYYTISINDKTISQIEQKMNYITWVGKLIIARKEKFLVFNTLNNKHIKILLKPCIKINNKNYFPQLQNQLILNTLREMNNNQSKRQIVQIQKLNNKIKIIRKIQANIPQPQNYKKCQNQNRIKCDQYYEGNLQYYTY